MCHLSKSISEQVITAKTLVTCAKRMRDLLIAGCSCQLWAEMFWLCRLRVKECAVRQSCFCLRTGSTGLQDVWQRNKSSSPCSSKVFRRFMSRINFVDVVCEFLKIQPNFQASFWSGVFFDSLCLPSFPKCWGSPHSPWSAERVPFSTMTSV